jgi:hypothetical protein
VRCTKASKLPPKRGFAVGTFGSPASYRCLAFPAGALNRGGGGGLGFFHTAPRIAAGFSSIFACVCVRTRSGKRPPCFGICILYLDCWTTCSSSSSLLDGVSQGFTRGFRALLSPSPSSTSSSSSSSPVAVPKYLDAVVGGDSISEPFETSSAIELAPSISGTLLMRRRFVGRGEAAKSLF